MTTKSESGQRNQIIAALDEAPLSLFHLRAVITSGLGFFTDAYDLFIIGAAMVLIQSQWHLNRSTLGLLGSTSLMAAFLGSFVFGRLADLWGRKKMYGLEASFMALGAIISAFSPNITWLLISRFIMGVGIGGDYPVSAVIMTEYANRKDRGKLVGMVFSMQAVGLILGPIVALTLLASGISHNLAWRLMLGLGALPALFSIYLRLKMPESPRYVSQVLGKEHEAAGNLQAYTGGQVKVEKADGLSQHKRLSVWSFLTNWTLLKTLIGTAGTWFIFDYAYYGNTISTPLIIKMISPQTNLVTTEAWSVIIFAIAAVPGYILAFLTIDRIGHKRLQLIGFAVMGLAFFAMGIIPHITMLLGPFLLLYGISYFFAEFGPNMTTFVLPAELYPVSLRTTGHGLSAGFAKIGAFVGVFVFPVLSKHLGLRGTLLVSAIFAAVGFLLTFLLPEPAQKSMENLNTEVVPVKSGTNTSCELFSEHLPQKV
ncbi:putative niacin/nicotinamide transporter NaiP [Desulfosporosinus acididurans]|uniref:Putative niacin/nicotinamide transporter NaiP n=1 Tax=Desulfosporosinus acididurans TaxID=476652 RepID=A0A0J1IKL6_9FIRM|nr:MFS transporter [Desulfosporosinus acididurans]KLU65261.1 putative niacin/nicotinamide transporter NaiP [Desulfosporosinus acididurans]